MKSGKCPDCGRFRKWLHKHHLKPQHQGGTDSDGLIEICANCHEDRHNGPFGGVARGRTATTPEARAKKSRTFKRLWKDPAYRNKVMLARKTGKQKDLTLVSAKSKAFWSNPKNRAEQSERSKKARAEKFWTTRPVKQLDLIVQ